MKDPLDKNTHIPYKDQNEMFCLDVYRYDNDFD